MQVKSQKRLAFGDVDPDKAIPVDLETQDGDNLQSAKTPDGGRSKNVSKKSSSLKREAVLPLNAMDSQARSVGHHSLSWTMDTETKKILGSVVEIWDSTDFFLSFPWTTADFVSKPLHMYITFRTMINKILEFVQSFVECKVSLADCLYRD